jgi:aspartyl aminopeptidase
MHHTANQIAEDLIRMLDQAPTAFHACNYLERELGTVGFIELSEETSWSLTPGGRYFVKRNDSSLIAFIMGQDPLVQTGFSIVGAHTDSPGYRLKWESAESRAGSLRIGVEQYGGPISATWLDRDLSVAGRVICQEGGKLVTRLVDFEKPVCIIPNLAVHLNREVNKGFEYNVQNHLAALFSASYPQEESVAPASVMKKAVAGMLEIEPASILEMELFLYDASAATLGGLSGELVFSARIDNLAMCHAIFSALVSVEQPRSTCVGAFFDNEEIGSRSLQGANSSFFRDVLTRITQQQTQNSDGYYQVMAKSFLISTDGAHAVHPNFADKHDPAYAPRINMGPVIKVNANHSYATDGLSAARFVQLCQLAGVPYQKFIIRGDLPCGSTIGPMSAALLGVRTVDVGSSMWAMHSIRETCGVFDHLYMTQVLQKFYSC